MKRVFLLAMFSALIIGVSAQDDNEIMQDGWHLKGVTGVNLSQTALSNWAAGGESSFAGTAYLNGTLNRKAGNWLWSNALILEYGLTKTDSQGSRKVSDKIDFTTQLGYSANDKWFYTVMGDFKTQFHKGYIYPDKQHYISKFMAPAYSNLSLGIEYRPNTVYSIYFSPVAAKLTFVEDDYLSDLGSFGVDPGDKFKAEAGAYLKLRYQKTIMENVELITSADLFTAYDKSFGNVDMNWDLLLNMKINEFLSATVNTTLKYDDDVKTIKQVNGEMVTRGAKLQFKETIGVGIAYNF